MEIENVELVCGACFSGRLQNPFASGLLLDSWRPRPPQATSGLPAPVGSPLGDAERARGDVVRDSHGTWRYNDQRRPNRKRVYVDVDSEGNEYVHWRCPQRGCKAKPKRAPSRLWDELTRWIADVKNATRRFYIT